MCHWAAFIRMNGAPPSMTSSNYIFCFDRETPCSSLSADISLSDFKLSNFDIGNKVLKIPVTVELMVFMCTHSGFYRRPTIEKLFEFFHLLDLTKQIWEAEKDKRRKRPAACSPAVITEKEKSGHCRRRKDETMTTIPTVGQHVKNERCMEPGKPVYPPTYTLTHMKTHWLIVQSQHSLSPFSFDHRTHTMKALFQLPSHNWEQKRKPFHWGGFFFFLMATGRTYRRRSNVVVANANSQKCSWNHFQFKDTAVFFG